MQYKRLIYVLVALGFVHLFLMPELITTQPSSALKPGFTQYKRDFRPPIEVKAYQFEDPASAEVVLKRLEEEEQLNIPRKPITNNPILPVTVDENYCDRFRAYLIDHTEDFFRYKHFISDRSPTALLRTDVLRRLGYDVMPNITVPTNNATLVPLSEEIHNFWMHRGFDRTQILGKSMGCMFQQYSHIPGHEGYSRKDTMAIAIQNYSQQYQDRRECFSHEKYFPQTWILANEAQCKDFFDNYFNTEQYQALKQKQGIVYLKKLSYGRHLGLGVTPLDREEEEKLRNQYGNGSLCGKIKNAVQIQKFIANPLLINGKKCDFRIYFLIASTNPLIVYYHDGYVKVSLFDYKPDTTNKAVLLTNSHFSEEYFERAKKGELIMGKNHTQLIQSHLWTLERFVDYLIKTEKITDTNWLENYLRPAFKKAFIHLIRATEKPLLQYSPLYELLGVDFMFDENLNLWLIEVNTGPGIEPYSRAKYDREPYFSMVADMFEITFGLARSRLKRTIVLINTMLKEQKRNLRQEDPETLWTFRKRQFKEATKNFFEPEFNPSPFNGWSKFIDYNLQGVERYGNLLEKKCL